MVVPTPSLQIERSSKMSLLMDEGTRKGNLKDLSVVTKCAKVINRVWIYPCFLPRLKVALELCFKEQTAESEQLCSHDSVQQKHGSLFIINPQFTNKTTHL